VPLHGWHAGAVEYWYSQGFISRATYDGLKEHCDFGSVGTLLVGPLPPQASTAFGGVNLLEWCRALVVLLLYIETGGLACWWCAAGGLLLLASLLLLLARAASQWATAKASS